LSSPGTGLRLIDSWLHPAKPSYLVYFVTARCNARCEMCFYWQEMESATRLKELTPDETRRIAQHLPRLLQLTLSGGEPFLREDLLELIAPFIEKTRPIFLSIPTNGILTERIVKTTEMLASRYPWLKLNLELSVDGVGEAHDRLRGRAGIFADLLKTWAGLKTLQSRLDNLKLVVLTVLSGLNQAEIFDTLKYIKSELQPDRMELMYARGAMRNPAAAKISIEKFRELCGWLEQESPRPDPFLDRVRNQLGREKRRLIIETVARDAMVMPCLAGRKLLVLDPEGKVRPCEMLGSSAVGESQISNLKSQNNWLLGDLREMDYDLNKILESDQARKILGLIAHSTCHCSYECAALANIVFRPGPFVRVFLKSLRR
jgi:MoaA/NifB/PqqE/SkfB family radical SAM enzyme